MEFVPKSVHWLLPEEACPCDILLHFRGQFATAIPAGQPVTFKLLEKLAKTQCTEIYVRAADNERWSAWARERYPFGQPAPASDNTKKEEEQQKKQLYGNKRTELLSYVQKTVKKREDGDKKTDQAFLSALALLRKVVNQPSLDWYFKQFHEPPDLFHHNARVAHTIAIFCGMHPLIFEEEIEALVYSALIHELEGNPVDNIKTVVSQQTLALLEERKDPVPRNVIALIELQDELCSGKGFPSNYNIKDIPTSVRIFTLCNHFDQYRLACSGTRRVRFDRTKQQMEARKADYDPTLWPLFWELWEQRVEAIS